MHELQPEIERLYATRCEGGAGTGRVRRFYALSRCSDGGPNPGGREDRRRVADECLGERRHPAGLSHRQAGGERRPARALVRRQRHLSYAALRRQRADSRDPRRLVGAQRSLCRVVAWSACRRCSSTPAPTSTRARWSIRMRWWARARRSASEYTSAPRRRSVACWSRSMPRR